MSHPTVDSLLGDLVNSLMAGIGNFRLYVLTAMDKLGFKENFVPRH